MHSYSPLIDSLEMSESAIRGEGNPIEALSVIYHEAHDAISTKRGQRAEALVEDLTRRIDFHHALGDVATLGVLGVDAEKIVKDPLIVGEERTAAWRTGISEIVNKAAPGRDLWQQGAKDNTPRIGYEPRPRARNFRERRSEKLVAKSTVKLALHTSSEKNLLSIHGNRRGGHMAYSRNFLTSREIKKDAKRAYREGEISGSEFNKRKTQAKYGMRAVTTTDEHGRPNTHYENTTAYTKSYGEKRASKRRWAREAMLTIQGEQPISSELRLIRLRRATERVARYHEREEEARRHLED